MKAIKLVGKKQLVVSEVEMIEPAAVCLVKELKSILKVMP
jgi:hypothetical protein